MVAINLVSVINRQHNVPLLPSLIILSVSWIPKDHSIIALSFDISKAFDTVCHDTLLATLYSLGLPSNFINIMKSYLQNRLQRVKYKSYCSDILPITSGVPQGSVLGPLLFNLYIASLVPSDSTTLSFKYADDTTFVLSIPNNRNVHEIISEEIKHVKRWCLAHGLSLNDSKTKILPFTNNTSLNQPINFDNLSNYVVNHIKIVGYTIDINLQWSKHINDMIVKISRRLYLLRLLKYSLNKKHLINIYQGLVQSLIDYILPIYCSLSNKDLNKIEHIIKRSHNIICGITCKKNCLPNLNIRLTQLTHNLFNKVKNDDSHILYPLLPQISTRSSRFILPHVPSNRYLNSFFIQGAIQFNSTRANNLV